MFCSNCGHNLAGNQGVFCPNCGAKASDVAVQTTPAPTVQNQNQNQETRPPSGGVSKKTVKSICITLLVIIIGAGSFFAFGNFGGPNVGEIIEFGGIEWRVLDRRWGRTLVISEYVLERRTYHTHNVSINWANSDMRQYLNGEFLNRFTPEERQRIVETRVVNDDNPWFDTDGGPDTTDYVFLLSLDELVRYFGDSRQLGHPDNTYVSFNDRYDNDRVAHELNGTVVWWWLRSPGGYSARAASVSDRGRVSVRGAPVRNIPGGVRPALWLNY